MEAQKSKSDFINWYSESRPLYVKLSKKVESIIEEIINDQKIPIHAINSRAKEINSFAKKIEDSKYSDPFKQITDLSGIRIIAYVESDLDIISKLIEKHFVIDKANSVNKNKSLGTDKVGYRSIHYIAKLPDDRLKFPEYKKFENLCFEIQLRTILQHAWAEIEHDKNYKFTGVLPETLKRRFNVLAGVLEMADREFNQIASEIDKRSDSVTADTKQGKLDISIDSTSIKSFLKIKFDSLIKLGLRPEFPNDDYERKILIELSDFGIITLEDLDRIIPDDFNSKILNFQNISKQNYAGILRDIMMLKDANKYFKRCWKKNWLGADESSVNFIKSYNPAIEEILNEHDVEIADFDPD
ncbi:MAG TPA: hypothetical protein VK809_10270 [Bacteroidia bacterium]|jgi:putative GTP pyrophosphokinase|nr:hypothetical protein [Bacteroidia bacterium]